MTIQELDRLISKTELNSTSKQVLRKVRKAIISGNAEDPVVGQYTWSIEISNAEGYPVRVSFQMRRHG